MGGVIHPVGHHIGEKLVPVDNPKLLARCRELEKQIKQLASQEPKVIEQIKVVEKVVEKAVDNPELLERLNVVLKENGELKTRFNKGQVIEKIIEKIVPVEKQVEVERVVEKIKVVVNVKLMALASSATLVAGIFIGKHL